MNRILMGPAKMSDQHDHHGSPQKCPTSEISQIHDSELRQVPRVLNGEGLLKGRQLLLERRPATTASPGRGRGFGRPLTDGTALKATGWKGGTGRAATAGSVVEGRAGGFGEAQRILNERRRIVKEIQKQIIDG